MKKLFRTTALLALLAAPAFADLQIVKKTHTDATKVNNKDVPAKDTQSTIWLTKDRMHIASEELTAIVRLDQKKLILLDDKAKTWTAIDLPFDLKKYVPPEAAGMVEQMMGAQALQAKVEPKDETKKFGEWNAKRYEITLARAGRQVSKEVLWTTKDIKSDVSGYGEMYSALMAMDPRQKNLATELKKLEGFPVYSEKTQSLPGGEQKSVEELVSATEKEAPAGTYDTPAGYKEKPFDPMSEAGMHGGPGGH
jgi:hypothetical protein